MKSIEAKLGASLAACLLGGAACLLSDLPKTATAQASAGDTGRHRESERRAEPALHLAQRRRHRRRLRGRADLQPRPRGPGLRPDRHRRGVPLGQGRQALGPAQRLGGRQGRQPARLREHRRGPDRTPTASISPWAPTPTAAAATGPSCARRTAGAPGSAPTCRSRWAATRTAARPGSGWPWTRTRTASCSWGRATTACGKAPTPARPGPKWTRSPSRAAPTASASSSRSSTEPSGARGRPRRVIYAAVSQDGPGLYRSADGGATWQPVAGQPTGLLPHQGVLAPRRLPVPDLRQRARPERHERRGRLEVRHQDVRLDRHLAAEGRLRLRRAGPGPAAPADGDGDDDGPLEPRRHPVPQPRRRQDLGGPRPQDPSATGP